MAGDQPEPDLNLVHPGGSDRSAVKGDVRIVGKPVPHLGGEVRAKVVHHDMKFAVDVLGSDRLHERKKLLRTASGIAFTSDFSSRDVQRTRTD